MGTQADIEYVYDDLDERWRSRLGEHADISAAFYNGDYGKTLEEAQRDKHLWVLKGLDFKPGDRVIDIGCGWGPVLKAVKEKGGVGVGLTLSPKQADTCRRHGLDARLLDWKKANPKDLGEFNAVISIGAFEHFCSVEEFLNGESGRIYGDFFRFCGELVEDGGKLFLQTMTWGKYPPWGARTPAAEDIEGCSTGAPKKSDERTLACVRAFFPGSWAPRDLDQIVEAAKPYFTFLENNDGRLDYVQTMTEWEKRWFAPGSWLMKERLRTAWNYLASGKDYRAKLECLNNDYIRELFVRNLFGHQRIFFRKNP